jgi:hypothetical protein
VKLLRLLGIGISQQCLKPVGARQPRLKFTSRGPKHRVTAHLIRTGWVDAMTAQRVGPTTDARKMFSELRREGLLYPASDDSGHLVLPNASGVGTHRRHKWTGKKPTGWKGK